MGERDRPRLFNEVMIPTIPDGMIAIRFHGRLAFIPKREGGEPLVGKTKFTKRQVDALFTLKFELKGGPMGTSGSIIY
jgi:hypothetical protein